MSKAAAPAPAPAAAASGTPPLLPPLLPPLANTTGAGVGAQGMTSAAPHHVAWSAQPSQFARFQKQGSDSMIVVVQAPQVSVLGASKQHPTKPNSWPGCGCGAGCGAGVGAGDGACGDTSLSPHHFPPQLETPVSQLERE